MLEWLYDSERNELRDIVAAVSDARDTSIKFGELTAQWQKAVLACKKGYASSLNDYTNDLGARLIIQEIIDMASRGLKAKLQKEVEEMDKLFSAVTQELPADLLTLNEKRDGYKYSLYSRIPTKLVGALKDDLEEIGFSAG